MLSVAVDLEELVVDVREQLLSFSPSLVGVLISVVLAIILTYLVWVYIIREVKSVRYLKQVSYLSFVGVVIFLSAFFYIEATHLSRTKAVVILLLGVLTMLCALIGLVAETASEYIKKGLNDKVRSFIFCIGCGFIVNELFFYGLVRALFHT